MNTGHRKSWDDYFFGILAEVSSRATCNRGRSGCVIVRDNRILTTGYVGSPPKMPHCDDVGHLFKKVTDADGNVSNHCVRTSHSEMNAICQAAKIGISLEGATMYTTMTPCPQICAKMIMQVGILKVNALYRYKLANETEEMFSKVGIEIAYVNNELKKYE